MRKIRFLSVLITLGVAISFTALAAIGAIYLIDYAHGLTGVALGLLDWHDLAREGSGRWLGVVAMIIGQMVVLGLLLMVRRRPPDDRLIDSTPRKRL